MKIFVGLLLVATLALTMMGCNGDSNKKSEPLPISKSTELYIVQEVDSEKISIYRKGTDKPIVVQNIQADFRPFIHPVVAPDGNGILTEYSPGHHKHQTGLYWGFTRINDRDYFHNPGNGYWKKISASITEEKGNEVKWQTIYDLLDSTGKTVLTETQNWTMREDSGKYVMSLEWKGLAKTDITIGKYDYGGMFLRMPWKEGIAGEAVNNARQKNNNAEGQRAMWVDVGMQIEGRQDEAHIAILDHPDNRGYPQHWRVDNQLGIGPAPSRKEDIKIEKGNTETIRHQLFVYTGEFNDTLVSNQWARFSGKDNMYSTAELWRIAQEEALDAKFLTPDEAVAAMSVKTGSKVNAWASEPLMTQPMAFCWDDRGRIWVAENRDYESRGHGFSNSGQSRILILEDTNHDGKADTRKVFMEGLAFPAALAVGFDGVFVGAPPNLLFIPDRNHDDKADVKDIEIRLTGWGISDRHETLNSFHWGPDGWLYGLQGFATPSKIKIANGKGKLYKHKDKFPEDILEGEGTDINGGVWRYHPTKNKFEVVSHGFSNPWGIDYDAKGQLFITACVIPHLWHVIPGGIYHRQGGQHFNPYIYDDIKTITDHSHRSAHGGARIYQSDAFPSSERGRIFMANIHEHAVLTDILKPQGSGFTGIHGDEFMMANNGQWIGFSMEVGPDGGLYVLDWHDADICGQKVLNTETGRIFRIIPEKSAAENWAGRYGDLSRLSDRDLVVLQKSKSDWHSRRARVILQSRAAQGKLDKNIYNQLLEIFRTDNNTDYRLKALWSLHVTNGLSDKILLDALSDRDEYVRSWAIQLVCEDKSPKAEYLAKFTGMAQSDPSPVVRLYLSSAMQRIDKNTAWEIASRLVKHAEDINDHNLPKMIWYGFEPLASEDISRALKIASESNIPLVAKFTARRAVDGDAMNELVKTISAQPRTLVSLLEGMLNGMEGRTDIKAPPLWASTYAKLKDQNNQAGQLARQVSDLFRDTEASNRMLATLKNKNATADERKKALQSLAAQQNAELINLIPGFLVDNSLRFDAIRSIAAFDEKTLGELLIKNYKTFNDSEKAEAIQTLSSRPVYGWILTQALKNNTVPRRDVPPNTARQLRRVVGSGFVEVWGPIDDEQGDKKLFTKYKNLLNEPAAKSADLAQGQQLFMKTCGSCHKMFGQGGKIGPDLTGSNRSDIDYLLFNILNPSGEIQDDYKMVVITTRDGRTYSGTVVNENQRQITLRVVGQDDVILNKSSIQTKEMTAVSMMPQGLLNSLTDKETINLLSYLKQTN